MALVGLAGAAAGAQPAAVSPKAFAEGFYRWYAPIAYGEDVSRAWELAVKVRKSSFSSELVQLITRDAAAQTRCSEVVGLDFDPFLSTQDPAERYELGPIIQDNQSYHVDVYPVMNGTRTKTPSVKAEFVKQERRYFFTNFIFYDLKTDLLTVLKLPIPACSR
jgi:hypothetical protein